MEKSYDKVTLTDENGNKTELNVLFTWTNEENGKTYIFIYSDEQPDEIIPGILGENDEVLDIEDEDEFDVLDEVLASYLDEQKI